MVEPPSPLSLFPGNVVRMNKGATTTTPLSVGSPSPSRRQMTQHKQNSMGDTGISPAGASCPASLPEGTSTLTGALKVLIHPNIERCSSQGSTVSAGHVEKWSPAATDRSTTPFDSRPASPSRLITSASYSVNGSDSRDGAYKKPFTNHVKLDSTGSPRLRRMIRLLSTRSRSMMSGSSAESPRAPESSGNQQPKNLVVEVVSPGSGANTPSALQVLRPPSTSLLYDRVPAPYPGVAPFLSTVGGGDGMVISSEEVSPGFLAPEATKRARVEGHVEEGGVAGITVAVKDDAQTTATSRVEFAPVSSTPTVTVRVADVALAAPTVVANRIVLPCPPADHEKELYYKTGRVLLVSFGLLSFMILSSGMWLFTIASPYFFWFSAPTVLLMFYFLFHYVGVAIWGKDFEPTEHAKIVEQANAQGYLPTVDVFLPVCNENIILLENTWRHVAAMDYPNFAVYVLDDGAKDEVRNLAAIYGFQYVRRENRPELKKAGNLRYAFARTSGEAVAIFDADFCPRSDFLRETTPYLLIPDIGILQTPQFFRWRPEQTWVEQGAGPSQEFFYRMVQMNQDKFSGAVCVGSCGVYRRAAVAPFGGVVAIEHSEDMYTGFKIAELGYKIKYLPLILAMGTCPDEPRSFFMQQYRWCMGSATLIFEPGFWSANIGTIHKICFFNGLLYYIATALLLFLAPIPILLLLLVKADGILWFHSGFALPSLLMAAAAIPIWSSQRYGVACHRVRVIQCYAHLFALKDHLMGTSAAWIPSGGGAARTSSKAYRQSVWLMVTWSTLSTGLIVGGCLWRMLEFPWFHFVPAIFLALGNFHLNISTLMY